MRRLWRPCIPKTLPKKCEEADTIESDMQPALNRGEFKAYLQPKWDIVKDHIIGGEILVRWIKDDGSVVYPSDFIPIFEQNGFVEKLDFYMLEKLCEKIRSISKKAVTALYRSVLTSQESFSETRNI